MSNNSTSNKHSNEDLNTGLKIIKNAYENPLLSEVQKLRLQSIIEKLSRYIYGNLNHCEDLTQAEKDEKYPKILKSYILDHWGNCQSLRNKVEDEGLYYFYHSYTTVPVDFDYFACFFVSDDDCFCGACNQSENPI